MRTALVSHANYEQVVAFPFTEVFGGANLTVLASHKVIVTSKTDLGHLGLCHEKLIGKLYTDFPPHGGFAPGSYYAPSALIEAYAALLQRVRTPAGYRRIMQMLGWMDGGGAEPVVDWAREFEFPVEQADDKHLAIAAVLLEEAETIDFETEFFSARNPGKTVEAATCAVDASGQR